MSGDGHGNKEIAIWVLRAVFQTEAKKASSVQGTWKMSVGLQWIKRGRESGDKVKVIGRVRSNVVL